MSDLITRLRDHFTSNFIDRLEAANLIEQQSEAIKGAAVIADAAGAEIRTLKARIAELEARAGEAVAWQVRRADGRIDGVPIQWEPCTKELYDATLATGRYAGYENGPRCEVRALCVFAPTGDAAGKDSVDAARYRFLRRRAVMVDYSDETVTRLTLFKDEGPTGEFLDDWVDGEISTRRK